MDKLVLSRMEGLNKVTLLYQMMFYGITEPSEIRKTNKKLVLLLADSYDQDFENVQARFVIGFAERFLKNQLRVAKILNDSIDESWELSRINLADQALLSYTILTLLELKPEMVERRSKVIINDTMDIAKLVTVEKNLPFIQKTLDNALKLITE